MKCMECVETIWQWSVFASLVIVHIIDIIHSHSSPAEWRHGNLPTSRLIKSENSQLLNMMHCSSIVVSRFLTLASS